MYVCTGYVCHRLHASRELPVLWCCLNAVILNSKCAVFKLYECVLLFGKFEKHSANLIVFFLICNCRCTHHDQVMKTCCAYCCVSLCCRNQANLRRCSTQMLRMLSSLKPSTLSLTWRSKNYLRMLSHSAVK